MYEPLPTPVTGAPTTPGLVVEFAGFRRRFFARALDWLIVGVFGSLVSLALNLILDAAIDSPLSDLDSVFVYGLIILSQLLVGFLYFTITTASSKQATFGKRALGIYVTDEVGNRLTFAWSAARVLANWLTDLTFLIGYVIQRFTFRRQALHDKIAGTLVLRSQVETPVPSNHAMRNRNQLAWEPSFRSGWLKGSLLVVPLVLLLCGAVGYFVAIPVAGNLMHRFEKNTRLAMTDIITFQVENAIDARPTAKADVRLDSFTLDINTLTVGSGSGYGVEISNNQTTIYGFTTIIDRGGVAVWSDQVIYRGIPAVVDGQVVFTQVERGGFIDRFLLSPVAIERALEDGINQALKHKKLIPTGVSLFNGVMTVAVEVRPLEFAPRVEPSGD